MIMMTQSSELNMLNICVRDLFSFVFFFFFWGGHTFLPCSAYPNRKNLKTFCLLYMQVAGSKIPGNIFRQAALPPPPPPKKRGHPNIARIIPDFCPNFARFLPEFSYWQNFRVTVPPPPVPYSYDVKVYSSSKSRPLKMYIHRRHLLLLVSYLIIIMHGKLIEFLVC